MERHLYNLCLQFQTVLITGIGLKLQAVFPNMELMYINLVILKSHSCEYLPNDIYMIKNVNEKWLMIKNVNNFIREFFPNENCIFSENCKLYFIFLENIRLLTVS